MEEQERMEEQQLKTLICLKEESSKLPSLPKEEKKIIEANNRFKSVYFSNKLEGNTLTEKEAKDAIFSKDL